MSPIEARGAGRRVLVTGATGFIGAHVVRRLLSGGLSIRAFVWPGEPAGSVPRGVETVQGDVRDRASVGRALVGIDWVVHLAGRVHDVSEDADTEAHDAVTVQGTRNVVDEARAHGVAKLVFLSSLSVYGTGGTTENNERTQCRPTTAYGRAKLEAQRYVLGQRGAMHAACLQPAMVYGAGCKGNLRRMMAVVEKGLFPPLPEVGNRRSLVYVGDVAQAVVLTAESPASNGECFILTDGEAYSGRRIYEAVCVGLGKRVPGWHAPAAGFRVLARFGDIGGRLSGRRFPFDSAAYDRLLGSAWFSCSRIKREIGFRPSATLESAMAEMVDAFRRSRGGT
jgi:UDP-glucose 4-epimerase